MTYGTYTVCINKLKLNSRKNLQQSDKAKGNGDLDDINEQPPKIISHFQDGEENSDGDLSSSMMTTTETDCTISPTIR